jgi:YVTN family beta-propeller protein
VRKRATALLRATLGVMALAATALGATALGAGPGAPGAGLAHSAPQGTDPGTPWVYVTNQDDATVSVVDALTLELVETVDLRDFGFGENARPHHAQVEPDGSAWYVTLIGEGKVLKLSRENELLGTVETEVPGLLALDPERDLLAVARSMTAVNPPASVLLIRRSDFTEVDEVGVLFPRPHALTRHPSAPWVYTASLGVNQLAAVHLEEGWAEVVDLPGPPHGIVQGAVSPDGRWLALTAELSDRLLVLDLADPARPAFHAEIPMADGPFEPGFTLDGRWLYVTNLEADRVTVVDTGGWAVVAEIAHEAMAQPHGIGFSPDGRFVFVSNRHQSGGIHDHHGGHATASGTLVVIRAGEHTVEAALEVGRYAAGVGAPAPTGARGAP